MPPIDPPAHKILTAPAGSPHAVEARGVAVGLDDVGELRVVRSGVLKLSAHERLRLADALADLLADLLGTTPNSIH